MGSKAKRSNSVLYWYLASRAAHVQTVPCFVQDVDGYKSTTYYKDSRDNETGYNLTGMNTSSSVENIQAMDK
jgi:hypothetical protein